MNRKKRNLNYIRLKNKLRKGDIISEIERFTQTFTEQSKLFILKNAIKQHETNFKKKYKLNIKLYSYQIGYLGNDFKNNTLTIKLNFKKTL